MRITLVLYSLKGGGSVLAAVNWANAWAERGHALTILAVQPEDGEGAEFRLHPAVKVRRRDLSDRPVRGKAGALVRLLGRLFALRREIKRTRPDVVIGFDGPLNIRTLMAGVGLPAPMIVMEETHPGRLSFGDFWANWRRRIYPRAAMLINLTRDAHQWSLEHLGARRRAVIPNPVLPVAAKARPGQGGTTVVAAGRLVDQKRFDLLVDAYARIADRFPDWRLVVHGEGPNRADLERRIAAAGLADRILLPGWTDDLAADMAAGEFFVLSSEYEGFGNVVAEALAVGLPVVSFDCPSGPGEIVRHEVDGLLVPPLDVAGLAGAMARLMGDADLRRAMAARAPEVLERFSMERTLALWDACFREVAPGRAGTEEGGHA
ncbi:glycosyltransferase family 4 protein [Pseudodesulfovibrio sp.]|uniref:glycosyltransferase family 4 protein n=1 Tax=Pseudodesulfovibrio sp. TaxID=2035812 RepID=UPI00261FCCFC|nr:glycosyltransferase family 4 protein [Pseudodesulfovibrio sp.]MDD3312786.1 glycosyltransferase family 4 protein [Pseudodesulfovibrio sp.]